MPIDPQGRYYDGTVISTPNELAQVLLKRPEPLVRTFTANLLGFAIGRHAEYYDRPAIRAIANQAAADDYRMSSFVLGVVQSPQFRMRQTMAAIPRRGPAPPQARPSRARPAQGGGRRQARDRA
jgi:hypothetical protein